MFNGLLQRFVHRRGTAVVGWCCLFPHQRLCSAATASAYLNLHLTGLREYRKLLGNLQVHWTRQLCPCDRSLWSTNYGMRLLGFAPAFFVQYACRARRPIQPPLIDKRADPQMVLKCNTRNLSNVVCVMMVLEILSSPVRRYNPGSRCPIPTACAVPTQDFACNDGMLNRDAMPTILYQGVSFSFRLAKLFPMQVFREWQQVGRRTRHSKCSVLSTRRLL